MSEAAVQWTGVHASFDGREVLRGLTASLPRQGLSFVIGTSGAGKSVSCRIAAGLLPFDSGEVRLLGTPVAGARERDLLALRRRAPYVVQGPALLDALTLEENVALAPTPPGVQLSAREALERVGLADEAGRRPFEVGPGAQKRTAIARALRLSPEYLLLDEPTTGLDRRAAAPVLALLESLVAGGLGALVISHDFPFLERSADHVLFLHQGRACFEGTRAAFLASSDPALSALRDAPR